MTRPDFAGVVPVLTPELWLPVVHAEEVEPAGISDSIPGPGRTRLERRGTRWMFIKGRLKPGVTPEQAHANVALIGRQLQAAHPETNKDRKMSAVPTSKVRLLVPQAGGILNLGAAGLMAVVGLVLLIACANVAGMLLARASARRREISVRLAIGASRARLVRQLVTEGAVLGILGAAAALGSAWLVLRTLLAVDLPLPAQLKLDIPIDWRVMTFAVVIATLSGVLASLLPALKASAPSLVADLRGEAPAARLGGRRVALRDALVVRSDGVHGGIARGRGAAAAQPLGIAASRRRLPRRQTSRCCRSIPTWFATSTSAGYGSGRTSPPDRSRFLAWSRLRLRRQACRSSSTTTRPS